MLKSMLLLVTKFNYLSFLALGAGSVADGDVILTFLFFVFLRVAGSYPAGLSVSLY